MPRTIISLDASDKAWLDRMARLERVPMTRLVRRAVQQLRKEAETHPSRFARLLRETAGLLRVGDGLKIQRKLREEWDRRG
jgi:hypothetical protein